MRRIIYSLSALIIMIPSIAISGEMDLLLRSIVKDGSSASWSKSLPEEGGVVMVPCLIKTIDLDNTLEAIDRSGGTVGAVAGKIISASIPRGEIQSLSKLPIILNIEFAAPLSSKMDTARAAGEVDVVQDGQALGLAYNGKNVVIGIVDDGLDYGHSDFLGADGNTRIQYVMQHINGEAVECTKKTIVNGSCEIEDEGQGFLHGTHVTGIAAGGNDVYTGVAPEADIMFVFLDVEDAYTSDTGSTSFGTNVLESASTIFDKANIMDKAAVVNLSLGTSIGAHDGTSLLEEGLTELTSAQVGRAIVNAAGNEQVIPAAQPSARRDYVGGIHASIDVADGSSEASRFAIWNGSGSAATFTGGTLVDIWMNEDQKDNCSVSIIGYTEGRSSSDFTFPGIATTDDADLASNDISFSVDSAESSTSDSGNVVATISIDDSDARNSKPHAMILVTPADGASSSSLESMWYDVIVRANGGNCTGNMWLYYDYTLYHDYLKGIATGAFDVGDGSRGDGYAISDGDSFYTMTIPATAVGVISTGSWLAEKPTASGLSEWTGANGTTYDQSNIDAPGGSGSTIDDLSSFSSLGPTGDDRTKPDIVAPGEPIISALARGASVSNSVAVNDNFYKSAGTSMASPYVAGVVALLLDRNNTLLFDEIKAAVQAGARTDGLTSKTTDTANSYGSGKIDAAAVLAHVIEDDSAYSGTGDLESPGGSSGCSFLEGNKRGSTSTLLLALLLSLCALSLASRTILAKRFR
ncbi:MAG: S8 family serine peptidase [Deltaproteobacteria bacterium]|jgi:minor extracellular serine protease Vpr|nr:S8 family serine peptidase [Deltaproteobacteria bacterium]